MPHPAQGTVTRLLQKLKSGNRAALDELFPLVYEKLHALAHRQRQGWHGDDTLNTTALIHEAYLKLVDQKRVGLEDRAHFFAVAAKAMRHILSNYAERRRAAKRGGGQVKLSLDEMMAREGVMVMAEERAETLLALDEAFQRLEQVGQRQSQIVECRFFAGMTIEETATALGISPATVSRDWTAAKAWLYRDMQQNLEEKNDGRVG